MGPDVRGRAVADPAHPHSAARVRFALLALALGGFAIGSTEFVAMGLLPDIARELLPTVWSRSQSDAVASAGALVSAYAAGVVVGAPTITALAARLPHRGLLLGLLVGFVLATAAAAILPTFGLVVAARFVAGLPHGAYFGVATVAASELLGPGRRGRAASSVFAGLTIANVIGVPVITAIGQAAGWRVAYVVVASAFAATFVAVWFAVPRTPVHPDKSIRSELRAFAAPRLWVSVAFGTIGSGGLFAAYTYVSPITTDLAGGEAAVVPYVLVTFGVGMTLGNVVGGRLADRGVPRALLIGFGAMLGALLATLIGSTSVVGVFVGFLLVGFASSLLAVAVQVRLMDVAHGSTTLAAASTHSALNIGNSLGAALGALVITAGLGYAAPIAVGIGLVAIGLVVALVALAADRRRGVAEPPRATTGAIATDLVADPGTADPVIADPVGRNAEARRGA